MRTCRLVSVKAALESLKIGLGLAVVRVIVNSIHWVRTRVWGQNAERGSASALRERVFREALGLGLGLARHMPARHGVRMQMPWMPPPEGS
jgi:hypothetical protein